MLCYAMLCYAMLCYAMLCYAMLCYAMLCYATCDVQSVELQKSHGAVPQSASDAGLLPMHEASGAARPS